MNERQGTDPAEQQHESHRAGNDGVGCRTITQRNEREAAAAAPTNTETNAKYPTVALRIDISLQFAPDHSIHAL